MIPKNPIQPLISDEMLGAYADSELDEIRRMEVEASLAANPEAAEFVSESNGLKSRLHRLFDGVLGQPLPDEQERLIREFESRMRGTDHRNRFRPLIFAGSAAAILALASVFVVPYLSNDGTGQQLFAMFEQQNGAETVAAVPTDPGRKPVSEALQTKGDVVPVDVAKPAAVVEALPKAGAPDLSEFGFELISTRLLAKTDGRSMQMIYEDDEGARVELFFSPQPKTAKSVDSKTSLTVMEEGPISVLFWNDKSRAYSLIGDVDRETLVSLGKIVNGQWTLDLSAGGSTSKQEGKPKTEPRSLGEKSTSGTKVPAVEDASRPATKPDGTVIPVEGDKEASEAAET